ncbi:hypothetical protein NOC27_1019 [Nitrosococcus oceani AFC27]|nr:hypothetical protein NOC27_1019 [Nitrosococcus oceani AFC27]
MAYPARFITLVTVIIIFLNASGALNRLNYMFYDYIKPQRFSSLFSG